MRDFALYLQNFCLRITPAWYIINFMEYNQYPQYEYNTH